VEKWGGMNILYISNSYFSVASNQAGTTLEVSTRQNSQKVVAILPQARTKKISNELFQDSSPTCSAILFFFCALQNVS